MATSVDERIVRMKFDNSEFMTKVAGTLTALTGLNKAVDDTAKKSVGFEGAKSGLASLGDAFTNSEMLATRAGFHISDVWEKMSRTFEQQIANRIVNTMTKIGKAMTVQGAIDGFNEYELKMGSIQTIMAGTGESLSTVNKYLEELNTYSDKTIYSFADMTNNIGKFTNAGVKLDDAVAAIKGIANEAALSGANANEASRAMYNFSQALSSGAVKLIDWKSIENANMATKSFKDTLLSVAEACGTVKKGADGMYTGLGAGNKAESFNSIKGFNDSLQNQWMTTEVLTKALKIYATDVRDLTEAEKEAYEAELRAMGISDEQIKEYEEMGIKAANAATEIKTFTMMMDTLKEAIGSGWATTWQLIVGDFEQAKELWTTVGNALGDVIGKISDARNNILETSLTTGWEKYSKEIPAAETYRKKLLDIALAQGKITEAEHEEYQDGQKFVKSLHEKKWASEDLLKTSLRSYYGELKLLDEEGLKAVGVTKLEVEALGKVVEGESKDFREVAKSLTELGGREKILQGLLNIFNNLKPIVNAVGDAFREVFPKFTAKDLTALIDKFLKFTENLKMTDLAIGKLKIAFKGFFSAVHLVGNILKSLFTALLPLRKEGGELGDTILDLVYKFGKFLTKLDETTTKNQTFVKFFQNVYEKLRPIVRYICDLFINLIDASGMLYENVKEPLSKLKDFIKGLFGNKDGLGIEEATSKMQKIASGEGLEKPTFFTDFITALSNGMETLSKIGAKIKDFFKPVGDAIKEFFSNLSDNTSGEASFSFEGLFTILQAFIAGGVGVSIISFLKGLTDAISNLGGIGDLFESISGYLQTMQDNVKGEMIESIGKGILMIAASCLILASIDPEALGNALGALTTMIVELAAAIVVVVKALGAMPGTEKTSSGLNLFGKKFAEVFGTKTLDNVMMINAISKLLISFAAALLLMSISLKIIADVAEGGHLTEALVVVSLLLAELVAIAILLSKYVKNTDTAVKGLMTMAASILILAFALKVIADVAEGGNLLSAVLALEVILITMAGVSLLLGKFGGNKGATGFITMAAGLMIVVEALANLALYMDIYGDTMYKAMDMLVAILAYMTIAMLLLSKLGGPMALIASAGILVAAIGLLILVQVLKQIADLLSGTDNHAWEAFGMIAAMLAILAVGLALMMGAIPGAVALTIASAALVILAGAVALFSKIDGGLGAIGLIGGMLVVLAVGLTLMIAALPGALALVVAAAGLTLLASAIAIFTKVGLKGIGILSLLFGALALISVIFAPFAVLLAAIGAALTLFSVGLIAVSVAIMVASAAFMLLVSSILMFSAIGPDTLMKFQTTLLIVTGTILKVVALLVIGLLDIINRSIPLILEIMENGILGLIELMVALSDPFITAVLDILVLLLERLLEYIPIITELSVDIIVALIQGITDGLPDIIQAGVDLIIALIEGIGSASVQIIDAAWQVAIDFINGLADSFDNHNEDLIEAVNHLMEAVIEAFLEWVENFSEKGKEFMDAMGEGISDAWETFKETLKEFVDRIKEWFSEKWEDFKELGSNLIEGFKEGLKERWDSALDDISSFGGNILDRFKNSLDEESPSKATYEDALFFVKGFMNGITDNTKNAIKTVTDLGGSMVDSFSEETKTGFAGIMSGIIDLLDADIDMDPTIRPVVDLSDVNSSVKYMNNAFSRMKYGVQTNVSTTATSLRPNISGLIDSQNGIKEAVMEIVNSTAEGTNTNVNVILQGDAAGVFKLVRQENKKFVKSTGYAPLAKTYY